MFVNTKSKNIFALTTRAVFCVIVSQHLLDPVQCNRYPGVDPGVASLSAAIAIAHHPELRRSDLRSADTSWETFKPRF